MGLSPTRAGGTILPRKLSPSFTDNSLENICHFTMATSLEVTTGHQANIHPCSAHPGHGLREAWMEPIPNRSGLASFSADPGDIR